MPYRRNLPERSPAIDQIAALPYRHESDGSVRVLLITSRDTKRWVLPKGNPIRGIDPHLAAAQEAYEEAGITGIACPSAIGRYPYDKRRANGTAQHTLVDVYPLSFIAQAERWPEMHERTTEWFTPADAANLVDETELGAIIAAFREAPAPPGRTQRLMSGMRRSISDRNSLAQWLQMLLPRQGRFFDLFDSHATTLVAGADALAKLLHGDAIAHHVAQIAELEQQADDLKREVLIDVRRNFVIPFDRSAITGLIGVMDDTIDMMHRTAKAATLYEMTGFAPQMRDLGGIIVEAARLTAEAVPLLRAVGANSARLDTLTGRLVRIEQDADELHDAGVRALFKARGKNVTMQFVVGREIYGNLERVVDCFGDIANAIQGLVIDHAR